MENDMINKDPRVSGTVNLLYSKLIASEKEDALDSEAFFDYIKNLMDTTYKPYLERISTTIWKIYISDPTKMMPMPFTVPAKVYDTNNKEWVDNDEDPGVMPILIFLSPKSEDTAAAVMSFGKYQYMFLIDASGDTAVITAERWLKVSFD